MKRARAYVPLIVVLVLFVAVTALIACLQGSAEGLGLFSPTDTGGDGYRAIYLLLEESGFDVRVKRSSIDRVPSDAAVLMTGFWENYHSGEEIAALDRWIRAGGALVIPADYPALCDWYGEYGLTPPHVAGNETFDETALCTVIHLELGMVYVLPTDRRNLTNDALRDRVDSGAVAREFLVSVWPLRERGFYVDDFAMTDPELLRDELLSSSLFAGWEEPLGILPRAVRLALLQGTLLLFVFLLFYRRRLGPPALRREAVFRAQNEDVAALADVAEKSRLRRDACLLCYRQFYRDVGRARPSRRFERFDRDRLLLESVVRQSGGDVAALGALHARIAALLGGDDLGDKELLALVARMDDIRRACRA